MLLSSHQSVPLHINQWLHILVISMTCSLQRPKHCKITTFKNPPPSLPALYIYPAQEINEFTKFTNKSVPVNMKIYEDIMQSIYINLEYPWLCACTFFFLHCLFHSNAASVCVYIYIHAHAHTCSEQSLRILMWNASYMQKHSNYTWQERVGEKTRENSKRYHRHVHC